MIKNKLNNKKLSHVPFDDFDFTTRVQSTPIQPKETLSRCKCSLSSIEANHDHLFMINIARNGNKKDDREVNVSFVGTDNLNEIQLSKKFMDGLFVILCNHHNYDSHIPSTINYGSIIYLGGIKLKAIGLTNTNLILKLFQL